MIGAKKVDTALIVLRRILSLTASSFLGSKEDVFSEPGLAEVHSLREKTVREDIARRLGKVCSNFSRDEFERLVAVMAARQVKCERRAMW